MSERTSVVVSCDRPTSLVVRELLGHKPGLVLNDVANLAAPDALELVKVCAAVVVTTSPVPTEVVAAMERCLVISRAGTGLDAIDIQAATERGIWVTSVPDYAVDEVSSHTILLVLALARRLIDLLELPRRGVWQARDVGPVPRIAGLTLGLYGLGRIGSAVARKAQALGMRTIAHTIEVAAPDLEVELVSWERLLQESDFLSLHVPLTPETRRVVNESALRQMKSTAYLVNTARGQLVDEDALREALEEGWIAGAALDVLTVEPPPTDHPFLSDPKVLLTPHAAWYSVESGPASAAGACDDVLRVLDGQPPLRPVNSPAAPRNLTASPTSG